MLVVEVLVVVLAVHTWEFDLSHTRGYDDRDPDKIHKDCMLTYPQEPLLVLVAERLVEQKSPPQDHLVDQEHLEVQEDPGAEALP